MQQTPSLTNHKTWLVMVVPPGELDLSDVHQMTIEGLFFNPEAAFQAASAAALAHPESQVVTFASTHVSRVDRVTTRELWQWWTDTVAASEPATPPSDASAPALAGTEV